MKGEELAKKREEAERKARRGEIDPTHEFTFQLIGQFSGPRYAKYLKFLQQASPALIVLWRIVLLK